MGEAIRSFTASNLCPRLVGEKARKPRYFGILNKAFIAKGVKRYGALGGKCRFNDKLIQELWTFNASFPDATRERFLVHESQVPGVIRYMLSLLPELFGKYDAIREFLEELWGNELGLGPILNALEFGQLKFEFIKQVAQPGDHFSFCSEEPLPCQRIFYLHQMVLPDDLIAKFEQHPAVRFFPMDELLQTKGGRTHVVFPDGTELGSNIFHF